ncbi:hypothetical protein MLD52_09315 [Puniceicoccaceae bacterium K14]|nr:hypothetical protein [Puniceicoccaceae bacterium K14]
MNLARHISHYFEKEYGPLLNICNLDDTDTESLVQCEKNLDRGFNRFAHGKEFFDFRKLADDLLLELYTRKFKRKPERRPYYAVLGDADVIGGLYRDPHKLCIPIEEFEEHEVTFMCPDHFHLVGLSKVKTEKSFGFQVPDDYDQEKYPYFGKLLTYNELHNGIRELKISTYLAERKRSNDWYRYVEAQIWANPNDLSSRYSDWIEVEPEPWSDGRMTHLQNYKKIKNIIYLRKNWMNNKAIPRFLNNTKINDGSSEILR